jgi:phage terminase small subunit
MPRGRKPRPTTLHRLHGSCDATRHRDRLAEPVTPGELGLEPPADLSDVEKEGWRHCVDNAPRGVLRAIDRSVLRIWVETEERYRRACRASRAESKAADTRCYQDPEWEPSGFAIHCHNEPLHSDHVEGGGVARLRSRQPTAPGATGIEQC